MTKPLDEQIAAITVPDEAMPFLQWANMEQLTCRQAAVLVTIKANPGCSTGAIATVLNMPKPVVTRAADKLEEWSLIHRKLCAKDRRMVELWPGRRRGSR